MPLRDHATITHNSPLHFKVIVSLNIRLPNFTYEETHPTGDPTRSITKRYDEKTMEDSMQVSFFLYRDEQSHLFEEKSLDFASCFVHHLGEDLPRLSFRVVSCDGCVNFESASLYSYFFRRLRCTRRLSVEFVPRLRPQPRRTHATNFAAASFACFDFKSVSIA